MTRGVEAMKIGAATRTTGEGVPFIEPRDQRQTHSDNRAYWNVCGAAFREAFIRLPAGLKYNELWEHPQVFKKLQESHEHRLDVLDRVIALSPDGWLIEARIIYADGGRATLAKAPKIDLPEPPPKAVKPTHTTTKVEQTRVAA